MLLFYDVYALESILIHLTGRIILAHVYGIPCLFLEHMDSLGDILSQLR